MTNEGPVKPKSGPDLPRSGPIYGCEECAGCNRRPLWEDTQGTKLTPLEFVQRTILELLDRSCMYLPVTEVDRLSTGSFALLVLTQLRQKRKFKGRDYDWTFNDWAYAVCKVDAVQPDPHGWATPEESKASSAWLSDIHELKRPIMKVLSRICRAKDKDGLAYFKVRMHKVAYELGRTWHSNSSLNDLFTFQVR